MSLFWSSPVPPSTPQSPCISQPASPRTTPRNEPPARSWSRSLQRGSCWWTLSAPDVVCWPQGISAPGLNCATAPYPDSDPLETSGILPKDKEASANLTSSVSPLVCMSVCLYTSTHSFQNNIATRLVLLVGSAPGGKWVLHLGCFFLVLAIYLIFKLFFFMCTKHGREWNDHVSACKAITACH